MTVIERFQQEVGSDDPVCVRGGGSHWEFGGLPNSETREVEAPSGIEKIEPAEMLVSVGAGTTLVEVHDELRSYGQETALDGPVESTVGGVLSVGLNGLRRPRVGAVTDALLQAKCVGADGQIFVAGGPTVKNVTGYDLCRLLVGSLGTIGLIGTVLLRTRPSPECHLWLKGDVEPRMVLSACYRPACLLWDGVFTWIRLEGYQIDVLEEKGILERLGLTQVSEGPKLPLYRSRWSGQLPEGGVLEVITGVVHQDVVPSFSKNFEKKSNLAERIKSSFDPVGRLNPGRDPYQIST